MLCRLLPSSELPRLAQLHLCNLVDVEIVTGTLEASHAAACELEALLSSAERDRAERFAVEFARRRYVIARGMLRLLLAERLEVAPDTIEIASLSHGKPVLAGSLAESGLCFNLSHSHEYVAYAFARESVGVDIERVRTLEDADDIAGHMFSSHEKDAYSKLGRDERALGFFQCWTRKEAFIKATGEGLSRPLDSFDVTLCPGEEAKLLRVGGLPGHACGWRLHSFAPGEDLVGAVVVHARPLHAAGDTTDTPSREARHSLGKEAA